MADILDRLKAALSDRYRIERELGSGGMATVYLARDLKHERQVAVKVLRPELAAALGPERFHQEIRIAANLNHPHILTLIDSGEADGFLFYVMPYIEGQSLRDKLAHKGELPIAEAVRILRDVVDALDHAHKHGVVHRDIKPDNVLLSERHALVTDFGVAKAVSDATGAHKLTTEGVALGTPAYMSPEQAAADKHIDHRADIYAVGALAYELLTGRPPFTGTTPQEVLSAQVTQAPEPVTKHRATVPPALAQVVMKCLEKKAADRWQSAEELLPQLEAMATPSGGITPTGTLPVERLTKRRWMMAGGAVGVTAIIAVIVVLAALPRDSGVTLDPERIVVAVFRNETGDPSLDQAGRQAGHWITQGLQQTGIMQVVPWETALQSSLYVQGEAEAGRVRDRVQALAEETGAATVISGAYYRHGDAIQYQLEIADAVNGRLLTALDPEEAPVGAPDEAIEPLRQQVLGSLAMLLDERIADQATGSAQPPLFEAYQVFDEGMEHYFRREWREALAYFLQSYELDTSFVTPLIYATINHINLSQWEQADALVSVLGRLRDRLSDYDQHWVDYLRARVRGDNAEALRAVRRAAELAPGSKAEFNRGFMAVCNNRPQETVDALLGLDPERGPMRGWENYWWYLGMALVMLGEHEEAHEATSRSCELRPDSDRSCLYLPSLTLAASGRVEEVSALFDDVLASSVEVALSVAECLQGYGHTESARQLLDRAITWFRDRPDEEKRTESHRYSYGRALFYYGRVEDARTVLDSIVDDFADSRFDVRNRGTRGFFAAMGGDSSQASRDANWLAALDRPYLRGQQTWHRAVIAGALGEREDAVSLLRQAFTEGVCHDWSDAWASELSPLRDYPPFQEFMRPKG